MEKYVLELITMISKRKDEKCMEELKRMLKAIHEENKDILTILLYDDVNEEKTDENYDEISNQVREMYDELFYGKEVANESTD